MQAHPDKGLAGRLHAARPDVYKDANHKPEMALAITPFEAMCVGLSSRTGWLIDLVCRVRCGFRRAESIAAHITRVPELRALVGEEGAPCARGAARRGAEGPCLRSRCLVRVRCGGRRR